MIEAALKGFFSSLLAACITSPAHAAQEFSTKKCARFGQPEFVYSSGDSTIIDTDTLWFASTLEGMCASGSRFKAGQTLLIGPVALKMEAAEGKRLRLFEPDMKSMPFNYVDSVARTLMLVRRQRETAVSLGVVKDISFAPLHQPLLMTRDALSAKFILMIRSHESGGTGWVLSDAQGKKSLEDEELQAMSVYEAALARPEILDFLALPDSVTVAVGSRKEFVITKDGIVVEPAKDSYLDLLRK